MNENQSKEKVKILTEKEKTAKSAGKRRVDAAARKCDFRLFFADFSSKHKLQEGGFSSLASPLLWPVFSSTAGKEVLIKSVIQAIPSYAMAVSLQEGKALILRHLQKVVGNGQSISILNDNLLPNGERLWVFPGINSDMKVGDLISLTPFKRWNVEKIRSLFPRHIADLICSITIHPSRQDDQIVWPHTKSGDYTVKTGYNKAAKDRNVEPASSSSLSSSEGLWKAIWSAKVAPKVKSFLWKLCNNALPTAVNVHKRLICTPCSCFICGSPLETDVHLFLDCSWVKPIWFGSILQWNGPLLSAGSMASWLDSKISLIQSKAGAHSPVESFLFYLLWSIWNGRNKFLFEGVPLNPSDVLHIAATNAEEFVSISSAPSPQQASSTVGVAWTAPGLNELKINFDAATKLDSQLGASVVILRDHEGTMLTGATRLFSCHCPIQAEAEAFKDAVSLALSLGLPQIDPQLSDIRSSFASSFKLQWIRREANKSGDLVAKLALRKDLPVIWSWSPPVRVRAALLEDKLQGRHRS
ncbi:uncharacterized protein G2W53_023147 [Senna tora]|uniref:Reverse transcriptase zinc-binding domain-containing protein n=1 Tax=Senna tora TaxID=362788 RepID=A0A834WL94_9FABA|nr:uncharacterized protein G2W53_023147 [Senna tora]